MKNNLNKNLSLSGNEKKQGSDNSGAQALDQLLAVASRKLGVSEAQLRAQLESGQLEQAVRKANINDPRLAGLKAALNDPASAEKLMKDPAAADIIKKFSK